VAGLLAACSSKDIRPNIVIVLADDLGYGDIGIQGCPDVPTPHIDRLALEGVRFTRGYVSAPTCSPSRAGLLSGRYGVRFGHEFNPGSPPPRSFGLPREVPSLAERLKAAGYATGAFGKWHVGYRREFWPHARGFDEFYGFLGAGHPYAGGQQKLKRGSSDAGAEAEYLTDAFAREAASFIERHRERPFLLYLPFNAVHAPLQAAPRHRDRFARISDPKRQDYATMLAALDDAVGRVMQALRAAGLEERTLVFFLSDNGGPTYLTTSRNAPLRGAKGMPFEGGIRVPFLLQWKDRVPAGRVEERAVISLDVAATALAAAGVEAKPDWSLDGVDLVPFVTSERVGTPHERLFWRMGSARAALEGDWKMVDTGRGAPALFNLAADVGEAHDLAAEHPERLAHLLASWEVWNRRNAEPRWGPGEGLESGEYPHEGADPNE
jgi:arylsulfatase A-like enzyme